MDGSIHYSTHRRSIKVLLLKTGSYVANHKSITHAMATILLTMAFSRIVKVARIVPLTTSLLPHTHRLSSLFFMTVNWKSREGEGEEEEDGIGAGAASVNIYRSYTDKYPTQGVHIVCIHLCHASKYWHKLPRYIPGLLGSYCLHPSVPCQQILA